MPMICAKKYFTPSTRSRRVKHVWLKSLGVSLSGLKGVVQRRRKTGNTPALAHGGGKRPKLTGEQREQLRSYVTAVQEWLEASHRIRLRVATLSRLVTRLDLPRKKDTPRHERDTEVNQQKRDAWRRQIESLDPARLVFIDESGVTRSMTRRYGRAPKGQRVHGAVPLGPWEVTTMIGALALDGVRACFTVEAATDADIFPTFVEQALQPTLRPGDVVIWDNLPAHKCPGLKAILESAAARLLALPPYSPDFNPIEQCWSKVKEFLRSAQARSTEALEQAIAQAFANVTASDARGWFQHCGYQSG